LFARYTNTFANNLEVHNSAIAGLDEGVKQLNDLLSSLSEALVGSQQEPAFMLNDEVIRGLSRNVSEIIENKKRRRRR
jgi:hypothetical protein